MPNWFRKNRGGPIAARPDAKFRRAQHVLSTTEADRTVLLEPVQGEYFGLDEVGTRIWELLPSHPSAAALGERLFEEYDAPLETLVADAAALLRKLEAARLVVPG